MNVPRVLTLNLHNACCGVEMPEMNIVAVAGLLLLLVFRLTMCCNAANCFLQEKIRQIHRTIASRDLGGRIETEEKKR